MKKMFTIGLVASMTLSGLFLISIMSEHVSPQYICIASLTFDELIKYVNVLPGSNTTVVFNGTLHVESEWRTTIEFYVTKFPNIENWTVGVSPSNISLQAGTHTVNITVIVNALPETNSNVSGIITINGKVIPWGTGSIEHVVSSQLMVIVKEYYLLSISSSEQYKETLPDSEITMDFEVQNMGNTADIFDFDIENYDELSKIGIYTWLKTSKLRVEGHDAENNSLGVYVSNNTSMGVYNITVNVFSENVFSNTSFFIRVISMIQSSSPLTNPTIDEGNSETFAVVPMKLDDNVTIEWYLDDTLVETGNKYIFNANYTSSGAYIVTVIVQGKNLTEKKSWVLTVNDVRKEEQKGFIPGFEAISVIAMLGVCVLLLNRQKK